MEEQKIESFKELNEELSKTQKYVGRISALMNPATYVIINIAIVVLVYVGAIRVEQGIITQGAVVALYNYMSQILVELIKFANLIVTINKAIACGNRIANVFEVSSSMQEGKLDLVWEKMENIPAVEFKHVNLTYQGSSDASLEKIHFEAEPGSVVGIIGGTGSGKTSLVNLIPRFYDATEGVVQVFGQNVKDYRYDALRKCVSVVPQKAVLFQGTIRENMKFGCEDASDEQIMEALKTAQALDVVEKKGGLDAMIEQGGRNLSGGQRQRLTIARALVSNPGILILDDSASALDYATDAALRESLRKLPHAPTVFIVSQRAASIRHADQIIVLDDGQMAGKGTHEELLKSCQVYQEIYYSQYQKEVHA